MNYEAQAAIELEAIVDPSESRAYPLERHETEIDPVPLLREVVQDLRAGVLPSVMAARFHNGVAQMVAELCLELRRQGAPSLVVLSGGVWQNITLLHGTASWLQRESFEVLIHRQVPPNDGGLALGQAAVAAARLRED